MGGHRGWRVHEKRSPKGRPVFPKARTAPAFGSSGSHCSPRAPGKGSVMPVPGRMCPQQDGRCLQSPPVGHSRLGWPWTLVLPSTGPRSRGRLCCEAAWEGTMRMCVSCAGLGSPTNIWGAGEGTPMCGCQTGVPRGLVPRSAPVPLCWVQGMRS